MKIKKFVNKKNKTKIVALTAYSKNIALVTGILILTNQLQAIGFYIIEIFPFMQKFG